MRTQRRKQEAEARLQLQEAIRAVLAMRDELTKPIVSRIDLMNIGPGDDLVVTVRGLHSIEQFEKAVDALRPAFVSKVGLDPLFISDNVSLSVVSRSL